MAWTFARKLGAGFATLVALTIGVGVLAGMTMREVVDAKDHVIMVNAENRLQAEHLRAAADRKGSAGRGFLLTGHESFLGKMQTARTDFLSTLDDLRATVESPESRKQLDDLATAEAAHQAIYQTAISARQGGAPIDEIATRFEEDVAPAREALDTRIAAFQDDQHRALVSGRDAATTTAEDGITEIIGIVLVSIVAAAALGVVLTRAISGQIGTAVQRIRSSSTELQAAATQQAAGSREQATAMTEIATTMSELLATSQQINDSARRVAGIASQTGAAAGSGDATVQRAQESIAAIRRQVDTIVGHMLELGRKSQQVGTVLDILNELSEQTNILSINATIEAAGAGEAGRRFAVVADEIRKLAERVAGSTKEIRALIEDVRAAVNTTVMATESGSKAVDVGARQFSEVATSFRQIASLVDTTTEASREIELSTQQQSSAVSQVNLAITNVAQATRETEASSSQTLQTAAELAGLSGELSRVVQ